MEKKTQSEILKEAKEKKKKERTEIVIQDFIIESYEYGWRFYKKDEENNKRFYSTLEGVCKSIMEQKIRKSSKKSLEDLIEYLKDLKDFKKEILQATSLD